MYQGVHALPWQEHVRAKGTLAVDAHVSGPALTHERYAAQRVKDAIVDRLRDLHGAIDVIAGRKRNARDDRSIARVVHVEILVLALGEIAGHVVPDFRVFHRFPADGDTACKLLPKPCTGKGRTAGAGRAMSRPVSGLTAFRLLSFRV